MLPPPVLPPPPPPPLPDAGNLGAVVTPSATTTLSLLYLKPFLSSKPFASTMIFLISLFSPLPRRIVLTASFLTVNLLMVTPSTSTSSVVLLMITSSIFKVPTSCGSVAPSTTTLLRLTALPSRIHVDASVTVPFTSTKLPSNTRTGFLPALSTIMLLSLIDQVHVQCLHRHLQRLHHQVQLRC